MAHCAPYLERSRPQKVREWTRLAQHSFTVGTEVGVSHGSRVMNCYS